MASAGAGSETSTLITRIAAGDRDAFSRFYDLLAPTAYGLIRRVLRDPEAAAEVLQEVFWQVWREAPQYDPTRGSPEAWLVMRAKTRAIDRLRSIRRRDRTFVAPVDESVARSSDEPAENPAVVAEDRSLVQTALAQLPEPQRRVIELAFYDGLTQSEIAIRLGEPLGTVKTRARLGLERLRGSPAGREGVGHMNREEIDELAAAYALGGLEADDRARFETLLRAGDPETVAALREFEATLADLAAAAPEPPPAAVKAALMERIAAAPPATREPARPRPRARRAIWPAMLSGAMAAGLAAIVVGWSVSSTYEKRLDALARDADQLKAELRGQQTVIAILRDPATQVVVLAGQAPAPTARARMMWHAKAGGVFVAAGLPEAPDGQGLPALGHRGQQRAGLGRGVQRGPVGDREPLGAAAARRGDGRCVRGDARAGGRPARAERRDVSSRQVLSGRRRLTRLAPAQPRGAQHRDDGHRVLDLRRAPPWRAPR